MTAGGVCTGLGVSPKHIRNIYGAFKGYTTRVGSGPFPTELMNEIGQTMQKRGNEVGATTGRPRRCGWLDLVILKYSCVINGVTDLVILKSDVLDTFDKIEVCVGYEGENAEDEIMTWPPTDLAKVKPVYKTFEGWQTDTTKCSKFEDLPEKLIEYLNFIKEYLGVKISYVSVGPDREQTIEVKN